MRPPPARSGLQSPHPPLEIIALGLPHRLDRVEHERPVKDQRLLGGRTAQHHEIRAFRLEPERSLAGGQQDQLASDRSQAIDNGFA